MTVDKDKIAKIAHLARIEVQEAALEVYSKDVSNILNLIEEMQGADTDDVEPMAHPLELTQRLREDVVTETDQRSKFQAIAPKTESGLFVVPRVIE